MTFRKLTDASLDLGGGFYLTYHRAATASQVARAYPRFREFLAMKERYDPAGVFQSDWYRHYRRLFAEHDRPPMKAGKASATARLIAGGDGACACTTRRPRTWLRPRRHGGVRQFLSTSKTGRWLMASCRSAIGRAAWRLLERATHPGIVRSLDDAQAVDRISRAGCDRGWGEPGRRAGGRIRHAGRANRGGIPRRSCRRDRSSGDNGGSRSVIETSLDRTGRLWWRPISPAVMETNVLRSHGAIDRKRRTVFLAEGLLMYLPEARVRSLLGELATVTDETVATLVQLHG